MAFAKFVIYRRQHSVLVRAKGRLLALTVLKYPQRVQDAYEYEGEVKTLEPSDQELELCGDLLDGLAAQQFALEDYEDPYTSAVCRLVQSKLSDCHAPSPRVVTSTPSLRSNDAVEAEQLLRRY